MEDQPWTTTHEHKQITAAVLENLPNLGGVGAPGDDQGPSRTSAATFNYPSGDDKTSRRENKPPITAMASAPDRSPPSLECTGKRNREIGDLCKTDGETRRYLHPPHPPPSRAFLPRCRSKSQTARHDDTIRLGSIRGDRCCS